MFQMGGQGHPVCLGWIRCLLRHYSPTEIRAKWSRSFTDIIRVLVQQCQTSLHPGTTGSWDLLGPGFHPDKCSAFVSSRCNPRIRVLSVPNWFYLVVKFGNHCPNWKKSEPRLNLSSVCLAITYLSETSDLHITEADNIHQQRLLSTLKPLECHENHHQQ